MSGSRGNGDAAEGPVLAVPMQCLSWTAPGDSLLCDVAPSISAKFLSLVLQLTHNFKSDLSIWIHFPQMPFLPNTIKVHLCGLKPRTLIPVILGNKLRKITEM